MKSGPYTAKSIASNYRRLGWAKEKLLHWRSIWAVKRYGGDIMETVLSNLEKDRPFPEPWSGTISGVRECVEKAIYERFYTENEISMMGGTPGRITKQTLFMDVYEKVLRVAADALETSANMEDGYRSIAAEEYEKANPKDSYVV